MENPKIKWMITGGASILGTLHIPGRPSELAYGLLLASTRGEGARNSRRSVPKDAEKRSIQRYSCGKTKKNVVAIGQ